MTGNAGVVYLVEYQPKFIAVDDLSEEDARFLFQQYGDKVDLEWPSPRTNMAFRLVSKGWVGFIPLGGGKGISIQPKVPLQHLFQMLEYAYDLKSFKLIQGRFDCETILDYIERLAILLADLLLQRSRLGLYRSYIEEEECLNFVRGRIDIHQFAKSPVKSTIQCRFEDQTIDNADNQIIAWTLHCLLRSGLCTDRALPKIRKAAKVLSHSVSLNAYQPCDCIDRGYNRLNADYETMHLLCRFLLEKIGPSQNTGARSMIPFLVNMGRLFESFVAKWFARNIESGYYLKAQEKISLGSKDKLMMSLDLVVYSCETSAPVCVLDTKYKTGGSVSPPDLYQVITYADSTQCKNAFLVYPFADAEAFSLKPGNVWVRSVIFDLALDLDVAGKKFIDSLFLNSLANSRPG